MYNTNHQSQNFYEEDFQLWKTIDYLIEEDLPFDMNKRYSILAQRCRKVIKKLNEKGIYKYGTA